MLTHTFLQFSLAIDINHGTKVNIRLEKYNLDREKQKKGRVVSNFHYLPCRKASCDMGFFTARSVNLKVIQRPPKAIK